jgi:acyl-CoA reductase-like NAD-dependent aldehyde dehydrogenase
MRHSEPQANTSFAQLDQTLQTLAAHRAQWVATPVAQRIAILAEIKECLMPVAQAWAETAARKKRHSGWLTAGR